MSQTVSKLILGWFQAVSRKSKRTCGFLNPKDFHWCFKDVKSFKNKEVLMVFQGNFESYKGLLSSEGVSSKFQCWFKELSRGIQQSFKSVSRKF